MLKHYISKLYRMLQTIYFKWSIRYRKGKAIVILGCGRSGTTFSSRWFKSVGVDVGHERLLRGGISSWYLTSNNPKVPLGPSFFDLNNLNKIVIHQVREPVSAISSMLSTGRPSWEFLSQEIPIDLESDSKILMAMKYYYYWNLLSEKKACYRVRAEFFELDIVPVLNELGGFNYDKLLSATCKSEKINTRKHISLTFRDLQNEDLELSNLIKELGHRYGYQVEF